jgi:hypothetical protein
VTDLPPGFLTNSTGVVTQISKEAIEASTSAAKVLVGHER